jgi:hypothetical protein
MVGTEWSCSGLASIFQDEVRRRSTRRGASRPGDLEGQLRRALAISGVHPSQWKPGYVLRRCQRTSIEQQHVQLVFDHHQPSRDHRHVGNLPPMPGVFPDYPASVVHNAGAARWGISVIITLGVGLLPVSVWSAGLLFGLSKVTQNVVGRSLRKDIALSAQASPS